MCWLSGAELRMFQGLFIKAKQLPNHEHCINLKHGLVMQVQIQYLIVRQLVPAARLITTLAAQFVRSGMVVAGAGYTECCGLLIRVRQQAQGGPHCHGQPTGD